MSTPREDSSHLLEVAIEDSSPTERLNSSLEDRTGLQINELFPLTQVFYYLTWGYNPT
jgi:hypothetical protein